MLQPDGSFENCYVYAVIYGYFEEEPDLVIRMQVWSYNDLAYISKPYEGLVVYVKNIKTYYKCDQS